MGNAPSESNMGSSLRCCKCYKVLSPCRNFSDYYQNTVNGRYVYVFNGGEYYRPVGQDNMYECNYCFNEPIRQDEQRREQERRQEEERKRREEERRQEEERKRREEERRQEEERKRIEEERRQEEEKKKEKLNQRLQESHQRAKEQYEKQLSSHISDESKRDVLIRQLDEFEAHYESCSDNDEFLEILSLKCSIPVSNLSLSQLTADQLRKILSVLNKLLFDEWVTALPSISTLQHTQVFITELCALSLEISESVSLQSISNHVQFLVDTVNQSACGVFESFLLTQALYLNLMHFFSDCRSSDNDAVLIARQWAEYELSTENLFVIEFLSTLTSSLQSTVGRVSVFVLKMEIQCLKLLLSTLTHLNGKETHSESTEMLIKLVQTNQWTPMEALTLLKALSWRFEGDVSISEILTLVQVYDISPDWTDEHGRSLIQVLESTAPERFCQDFQKTLRRKDESTLAAALAEVKMLCNLDDSFIDMIKNVTTGVLQYSENAPKEGPFMKDSFKCETLNADNIQNCLSQLCKAVFDIQGWWPTVRQMVWWCALVLTQKSGVIQLVGVEEDPCVTAMFAATQVCMGNKLDIVLSAVVHSEEQTKEWSDFYKYLDISLNTNMKKTNASFQDVYEADIVYGTVDDFVSDYFQHSIEVIETGKPQINRGFIIEKQSLCASHTLELSRFKENDSLVFAAEVLQNLMSKFHSEDVELRHIFIKAVFQVLHHNLNKNTNTDTIVINISKKINGKELLSNEVFILTFLENLLQVFTRETEAVKNKTSPAGKWCFEILFACVEQFQDSKEETKEVFEMVSNLGEQRLWSPVEALNLLGALTDHHHDKGCISIMKILHLMVTYQVSSKWTDEDNKSFLELIDSCTTETLIQHLEKILRGEKTKSIDMLFDEIRQMKDIDEQNLSKSYNIIMHVTNLIKTGKIENHTDVQQARTLSHSTETEDLQEILAVLCNAVHLYKSEQKWWPRVTQMISWCLLALSDTGKLLEMGTGEGKSCVIAMFAVLHALRGEKVDVVSSSSVLCQRDAEEWIEFYKYFGITVDTNTNKTDDKDRKECYRKDVVYGTIEAFGADHLRQIFEMKDVRPDRSFECIIIDEVDSLLLDQGVQLTYLSSPMVSMQHLNIILTMIWGYVSQYGFLSTGNQTFVRGPPASFSKAIYDSMNTEDTEINDPLDILSIAEECNAVPEGFTEDIYRSERDELFMKLKTVSQDAVVNFFHKIEHYVPYGFTVYTLDDKGLLRLQKCSPYNNQDIPELSFLVLEEGLCCPLYESEEILIKPIAELISEKIQYTPCENNKDKISIPGFFTNLVEKKVSVWVQNAFLAMQLKQGWEYVVKNDNVCPVDFRSTDIADLNKKWGDGLQQFVELKHQVKLSTISTVTNYISDISFFKKYQGQIYGTMGTLGSKPDIEFLQDLYPNITICKIPTFNMKKLYEVKGTLKTTAEEWKSEIKHVVMAQISPNSYRNGRAALVICETISKAKEIHEELKSSIPSKNILCYYRSGSDSDKKLLPGDVIVATNLAGRGTDIKVSKEVNNNGGLFVVLSFLSENTRVELQAFGQTAHKGKPGSAQVIISTEHLQQSFSTVSSLEEAKSTRDRLAAEKINHMMNDVAEMKLREDLFSEYCKTLQDRDDWRADVAMMNESWGIWLQTKSEEIDQLKRNELQDSLKVDLSSIYHSIKFGDIALDEKKWDLRARLFEKAFSIGVSLVGFGIGKIIAKGFKSSEIIFKGMGKKMKSMPQFLSKKENVSAVTNMKNAEMPMGKEMKEEIIAYGFGKEGENILTDVVNSIKIDLKERIVSSVESNMEKDPLATLVDLIILSQLEDKKQLLDVLNDETKKKELQAIFKELTKTAVQPFYADLSWQNKINLSLFRVTDKAKADTKVTAHLILTAFHIGTLADNTIIAVQSLNRMFFSNLQEQLNILKKGQKHSDKVKVNDLSKEDVKLLENLKSDLADTISTLIADALVEVLHQNFSRHIVSHVHNNVNGVTGCYIRKKTEDKLRAGQNNRYIAYMPKKLNSKKKRGGVVGQRSELHAEKIKNSTTVGTILDIRVLSEATGTKVVILTEDSSGRLTKMQELSPDTQPANQTVTLIYRPKSAQYPDGHYDVNINSQVVSTDIKGKGLFHALAQGMKPQASEKQITLEADHLRFVEADALLRHPGQWEPFIKHKEWTEAIRGGDWYMAEGAAPNKIIIESKEVCQKEAGKIESYEEWQKYARKNKGILQFINADHQPPVTSILEDRNLNQSSRLAKAMHEVGTNSSHLDASQITDMHKYHGCELPTVYVPKEINCDFPSTTSLAFRKCLATTISKDDVVSTFKLMILGSMPRFSTKNFENFQSNPMSKTRVTAFENSFQKHSKEMAETWFDLLRGKGVMRETDLTQISAWINKQGYNDQNDPHRNKVSSLL